MARSLDLALLTLVCAIWAGNYFVLKNALQFVDPISFSFLRAILGGLFIFGVGGYALRGLATADYAWIALVGFFNISLFMVLLNIGLITAAPGIASTLVYTQPVFVALFSPLTGERLSARKVLGIAAAFSGVAVVFASSLAGFTPAVGDVYALVASVSWATGIILFKKSSKQYNARAVTAIQLLAGGVFILPAFGLGKIFVFWTPTLFFYLGYSVVLATGFSYVLFYRILAKMPASQFSSYLFLVPIFTQVLGSVLQLTPPTWNEVLGTLLVAVGIIAVNR